MSREILLIYQDCPYCKPREEWGEKQKAVQKKYGLKVRARPFDGVGVDGIIQKAQSRGVNSLPFYTDGVRFSYELIDFVEDAKRVKEAADEAEAKPARKAMRKKAKAVASEEETDGDNQETK